MHLLATLCTAADNWNYNNIGIFKLEIDIHACRRRSCSTGAELSCLQYTDIMSSAIDRSSSKIDRVNGIELYYMHAST